MRGMSIHVIRYKLGKGVDSERGSLQRVSSKHFRWSIIFRAVH